MNDIQLSEHFKLSELACPCCGLYIRNTALINTLESIRTMLNKAVHINSGTRCAAHNKAIKSKLTVSPHMKGEAADICVDGMSNLELGAFIKNMYHSGLLPHLQYCYLIKGTTNTAVHIGVDVKPRKRVFGF